MESSHDFDPLTYALKGCPKILSEDLRIIQKTFGDFIAEKVPWMEIEFQVWDWSRPQLLGIFLGMAVKLGIVNCAESLESLLELALDITDGYLSVPYHNNGHAFDVAFMVYYMLQDLGVRIQLGMNNLELIALFIGALGHDMGHPGLNNLYQRNKRTELAIKYDNKSVLENYSIDLLYGLLDKNPYLKLICLDDKEKMDQIRGLIKILILNTDMVFHFDMVTKLMNVMEYQPSWINNLGKVQYLEEEDFDENPKVGSLQSLESQRSSTELEEIVTDNLDSRNLLISSILHAADISNPARPFLVSRIWSEMVMEEFFLQGDKEKTDSLPVSPSMDREVTNGGDVATGFTNLIVQPFFDLLSILFPRMDGFAVLLRNNAQWRETNSEPSPFQAMKEELMKSTDEMKYSNTSRKVSLAAGMIEIGDGMISSMAGKLLYKKKMLEDQSRRTTLGSCQIIQE